MREPACCAEVRSRLACHGLPSDRIERVMRELAEHWEDLRAEAMERGLSASEASAEADARLGRPGRLAADVLIGLREGSWLGRHPILALCVVPLFLAPLLMAVVVFPLWGLDELVHFTYWGGTTRRESAPLIVGGLWSLYYVTMLIAPAWLCWRVWREGLGVRWISAVCTWCALANLLRYFEADTVHRNISMGLSFPWRLNLHTAAILILHCTMAATFFLAAREVAKRTSRSTENKTIPPL
jgi:hypothetical protein